jgi:Protein of unknown function (DUF3309)
VRVTEWRGEDSCGRRFLRWHGVCFRFYRQTRWNAVAAVLMELRPLCYSFWSGNMLRTVVIVLLILLLLGALPTWGYSGGWGYYPSGGLGLVLVIVIILVLIGKI